MGITSSSPSAAKVKQKSSAAPYGAWKHGPPTDPGYFPIAVWLQSPENAARYKAAGINLFVGLWQGPTEGQLAVLKAAGMPVICEQNAVGLAHKDDPIIVGWMHGDEPDNAQPVTDPATGKESYGPPVPPPRIVAEYEAFQKKDPTRPIMLNLGQGVANDEWIGRGSEAKPDDYLTYVKGSDIVSFDVYPVNGLSRPHSEDYLWLVAQGVSRLRQWTGGKKIVWNCIEASHIGEEGAKPTPQQIKAEVWMALIHGSMGLIYFVHQFKPTFDEHALLDDPELLPAVTAINRQIHDLAPVLNSPTVETGIRVESSAKDVPIATMLKWYQGATYLFTVGMRNGPAQATFTVPGMKGAKKAEVLGEGRTLAVKEGRFGDRFPPFGVHLYRIR
jgi:hypothetical protein